jgi:CHAT domain-containing protein
MIRRLLLVILTTPAVVLGTGMADYNRAWMLWNDGRRTEAIEAAKAIIASDPAYYRAYNLIAEASADERHPEAARAYFRGLARADGSNPWPFYGLGRLEAYLGNGGGALLYSADCVKKPGDAWPCYFQLGIASKTERDLVRGLPRGANRAFVLLARAGFCQRERRFAGFGQTAREGLELARQQDRTELQAFFHELMGQVHEPTNLKHLEGLAHYEEAYRIFAAAADWESEERATLSIIGALTETGQLSAAEKRIETFQADARDHFGVGSQAEVLGNSASIRMRTGDVDGALGLLMEQEGLLEMLRRPVDWLLLRIGSIYERKGNFEVALTYMQRSYALADSDRQRAFVLRSIGVLYGDHGDYSNALKFGQDSVDRFQKLKMSWQAGAGMGNLADIHAKLGDFETAARLLHQALQSAYRQNDAGEEQGCLASLGDLYLQMGKPGEALGYLRKAEALAPQTSYESARVDTLLTIAAAHRQMGSMDKSVRYARNGLAAARAAANGAQEARALIELAATQFGTGAVREAEAGFQEALGVAEKTGTPDEIVAARRGLAEVFVKTARLAAAAIQLEAAVDRLEMVRSSAPGPELRSSFLSQNWRSYEDLVYVLATLHEDRKAFDYSERGRARAFLDVLARGASGAPVDLNSAEGSLRGKKEVLLDYMLGERESYLWAISGQGTRMVRLPGRARIVSMVEAFRASITSPDRVGGSGYKELARTLYVTLCAPAADLLKDARQWIVVPDAELYYLPFEALIGAQGRFLVEDAAIVYAPSPSSLGLLKRSRLHDSRMEMIAFGAPELPGAAGSGNAENLRGVYERAGFRFPALPHAREELREIALVFPADKTKVLVGAEASGVAVKSAKLADYKRLHFATHTIFDERSPERTGIVLTPVGNDDGIVRARDILKLRLDADIVVLSACQSGIGKLVRGEGIAGLSQAFVYAGAERVVVSSWEVNDLATSDLMKEFYAGLSRNVTPGEALQQAKLAMIRSGAPAYRNPYYWASFVLIGTF